MNLNDIAKAIDLIAPQTETEGENTRNKVRNKIKKIYKHNNPSKLNEIDALMEKYKGKEEQLLKAIEQKYTITQKRKPTQKREPTQKRKYTQNRKPWEFVLKNYERDRVRNWNIDESISHSQIQLLLNEMAESNSAECTEIVAKDGRRKLVVRQKLGGENEVSRGDALLSLERMRRVIQKRYEFIREKKSSSHLITNEHERRKEEKRVDQLKKKKHGKKR